MRKTHLGEHDMMRVVSKHGKLLVCCTRCLGYTRCKVGPKSLNRCRPQKIDSAEYSKVKKWIDVLEYGRVLGDEVEKKRREHSCHQIQLQKTERTGPR